MKHIQKLPFLLLASLLLCTTGCGGAPGPAPADSSASTTAATQKDTDAATDAATDAVTDAATDAETDPAPDPQPSLDKAEPIRLSFTPSVTITRGQDSAAVTHEDGLTYTASGYTAAQNNVLTFTEGLTLTFDPDDTAESFNRFHLGYTSTQPLYGTVTYELEGASVTDDFYLEAGANTFSCLISQYLDEKNGVRISSMQLETCNDLPADFALCVLQTEVCPLYKNGLKNVYYLENDRFKLGIRMNWGGGITYLEDKLDGHEKLKNLINEYDPGRMIQQSYYSDPKTDEYTPGYYNDTLWCYNPVQGGDVRGGHSRLIDVVVTDSSVYLKAQPCDWAAGVDIAPAYMENTYTIYSDRVQVDNRFVDFSGWEHNTRSQEMPAFYTVSYLDTFFFYNGTEPWTGDVLSYRDDLPFWSGSERGCWGIRESNTETWCAWTNTDIDYGIGLYVPNIDTFLAGRHMYDENTAVTSSKMNPCSYVAPLKHIKLTTFEPLEYSYIVTTGSLRGIRETFTEYKDFADNADLNRNSSSGRISDRTTLYNLYTYGEPIPQVDPISDRLNLTKEFNGKHISPNGSTDIYYAAEQGAMTFCTTGGDPNFTVSYAETLSADAYKTVKIEYMIPTANSSSNYRFGLFFCAGEIHHATPDAYLGVDLIADGQYHTLEADLTDCAFWTGDIHRIRFDYFEGAAVGDVMYIKSITLQ